MKVLKVFILLFPILITAQSTQLEWAYSIGQTGSQWSDQIQISSDDKIYVVGQYDAGNSTMDFDPGPGVVNINGYSNDVFIQKVDKDGNYIWAGSFTGSGYSQVNDTYLDKNNFFYLIGTFSGTEDFDPTSGTFNMSSGSSSSTFIVKLDINGGLVWAQSISGIEPVHGASICVDKNSNVLVAGLFEGTVDFDPGPSDFLLTSTRPTPNDPDHYILKLDSNGNLIWAKSNECNSNNWSDSYRSVSTDNSNNIVVVDGFRETIDIDPSVNIHLISAWSEQDLYIQKLDSNGNFIWAETIRGSDYIECTSVINDEANNIYIAGNFVDTVDFDPGVSSMIRIGAGTYGAEDLFVLKLDSNGVFNYVRTIGGEKHDDVHWMVKDSLGNLFLTGKFKSDELDFDPGPGVVLTNNSLIGYFNTYVLKLDVNGNYAGVSTFGSDGVNPGEIYGEAIGLDSDGSIYVNGVFGYSVDVDPGFGEYFLNNADGWRDVYVMKLSESSADIEQVNEITIKAYPNPTKDYMTLSLFGVMEEGTFIEIITSDLTGKVVLKQEFVAQNQLFLNFQDLGKGVYINKLKVGDKIESSFKLVME